jgi:hypothetical protein
VLKEVIASRDASRRLYCHSGRPALIQHCICLSRRGYVGVETHIYWLRCSSGTLLANGTLVQE